MEKGQIVELTIEDMSAEGRGIGKIYDDERGFAVFVQDTVVGDRAKVELTKVKKNYAFGRVSEMLALSQDRQESFCPHSGLCGGCVYSQLSYEAQLALKEKQVREKLVRLGGLTDPVIMPIIGMGGEDVNEVPFRYRNKASMPVSTGGLITQKGGIVKPVHEPRVGFYRPKSHDVVDCEDCLLQSEPAMAAAAALRKFMEEDHITSYDPRWEKGLMRHMIVRTAAGTGEVMVILVINGKAIPNAPKLIEMLDEAIYNVPVYEDGPLAGVEFNLESVIVNINKSKNLEGQILGEECITIAGKPTITEEVGGLSFEISPLSFYQVNREQMVRLYEKALEYASLKGDETVLDLYCGVGTIGLFAAAEMNRRTAELNAAAAAGQAAENAASGQAAAAALSGTTASGQAAADKSPGRVIGIESVKGAVLDANRNATINGIVNARYVCGKAEEELPKMVCTKAQEEQAVREVVKKRGEEAAKQELLKDEALRITHANVVILDPPRAGCEQPLLEAVVKAAPERIVYVSCDPATLARDIKWLGEYGYEFKEATPCDMFPWTGHVETVCLLSKLNTKQHIEINLDMDELDLTDAEKKATYQEIKDYVLEHSGLKVSSLYIAQVKQKCGIIERENYNKPKSEDAKQPQCPPDKEKAIKEALTHFGMI
jgi:23S rRNA (uracil-5-)-methyltransferase rumA